MTAAAVRHVERAISNGLGVLQADVAELKGTNETQLGLLREAAEERGRRVQREEDAAAAEAAAAAKAARASQAKLEDVKTGEHEIAKARAAAELEIATAKAEADVERTRSETKIRRWKGAALAIAITAAAVGTLIGAVVGSHH